MVHAQRPWRCPPSRRRPAEPRYSQAVSIHQPSRPDLATRSRDPIASAKLPEWVLWQQPRLQIREPDLLVIPRAEARAPRLMRAPLLAVEILSPSSFGRDAVTKRREYAQAGLDHYWIVDPETPQVAVYRRNGDVFGLVTHAIGDTEIVIEEPMSLRFRPSDVLI